MHDPLFLVPFIILTWTIVVPGTEFICGIRVVELAGDLSGSQNVGEGGQAGSASGVQRAQLGEVLLHQTGLAARAVGAVTPFLSVSAFRLLDYSD